MRNLILQRFVHVFFLKSKSVHNHTFFLSIQWRLRIHKIIFANPFRFNFGFWHWFLTLRWTETFCLTARSTYYMYVPIMIYFLFFFNYCMSHCNRFNHFSVVYSQVQRVKSFGKHSTLTHCRARVIWFVSRTRALIQTFHSRVLAVFSQNYLTIAMTKLPPLRYGPRLTTVICIQWKCQLKLHIQGGPVVDVNIFFIWGASNLS